MIRARRAGGGSFNKKGNTLFYSLDLDLDFIYPDLSLFGDMQATTAMGYPLIIHSVNPFMSELFASLRPVVLPLLMALLCAFPSLFPPFPPFHLSTPSRQILAFLKVAAPSTTSTSPQHHVEVPAQRWGTLTVT
jgi:hypothetical protein